MEAPEPLEGNIGTCSDCKSENVEVCGDSYCRDCHISLTFESCLDGSWANGLRARYGLPPLGKT